MDRHQGKRMTAEEKLRVVEEGRQSGAAISEVCRRHQIHHSQFYRWERLARQGALEALRNGAKKTIDSKREERLLSEVWKPSAKGMTGVDCLIAKLDRRRFHSAATYLRSAKDELFTVIG